MQQGFSGFSPLWRFLVFFLFCPLGIFADVCPPNQQPDGDELAIRESSQCLPRYLIHFKRVPKRRKAQDIPLEMRNATFIVLWLDPFVQSSSYLNWINENVPQKLCIVITFLNLVTLTQFIEDYPELTSKFKIVIHVETKQPGNTLFDELTKFFEDEHKISKLKMLIFIGALVEQVGVDHEERIEAKKKFVEKIHQYSLKHPDSSLLMYCQNRFSLLRFFVPTLPLFALRTSSPPPHFLHLPSMFPS